MTTFYHIGLEESEYNDLMDILKEVNDPKTIALIQRLENADIENDED